MTIFCAPAPFVKTSRQSRRVRPAPRVRPRHSGPATWPAWTDADCWFPKVTADRSPIGLLTAAVTAHRDAVASGDSGWKAAHATWTAANDAEQQAADHWLQSIDGDLRKSRSGAFCEFVGACVSGVARRRPVQPLAPLVEEFEALVGMGQMDTAREVARRIVAATPDAVDVDDEPAPTWNDAFLPTIADEAEVASIFGDDDADILFFHSVPADAITDADVYPAGCVS